MCMKVPQPQAAYCLTSGRVALLLRDQLDELADDVAEPMKVLLAGDVAVVAARELDVLLAAEHVLERLRLGAGDVPHLVGEHDGIAPGLSSNTASMGVLE